MSKFNPLCTILVTVIEGRYFEQNPKSKLFVECRFTDEIVSTISPDSSSILTTDCVEQVSFPTWDTELAWEIDRKTLHNLCSHWAHLKLQCFSVNSLGRNELVGYTMLDLRAAVDRPGKEKWVSLLNTHMRGLRPEVKISFCILANLSPPTTPDCFSIQTGKSVEYNPPMKETVESGKLSLQRKDDGLYLIGENPTDILLFSITINFGTNLELLLQNSISASGQQQFHDLDIMTISHGYFFQYGILDNIITSSRFYDLSHPNFKPESITFQIQSSLKNLEEYLTQESKLVINLYHDTEIIGFAEVPLTGLFDRSTYEPRSLDRVCPMYNSKRELPVSADVQTARIGVFLIVERENNSFYFEDSLPTPSPHLELRAPLLKLDNNGSPQFLEQNCDHEYRIVFELISINLVKVIPNIYIKYSYPALGITNYKSTQALVKFEPGIETPLYNGINTIYVRMTPQRLQRYFEAVPLLLELWQMSESKDLEIGVASLHLAEVFLSNPMRDEQNTAEILKFTTLAPIKSTGITTSTEMGNISVSIRLEDYGDKTANHHNSTSNNIFTQSGPVKENHPDDLCEATNLRNDNQLTNLDQNQSLGQILDRSILKNSDSRSSIFKFRSKIFQQAVEHAKFTQETLRPKKDGKHQSFAQSKVQQLKSIDQQLQKTILFFETRDESLLRSERDIERRWLELDRQFDQRTKDMKAQLEAELLQKYKFLRERTPSAKDTIRNLQSEIKILRSQLEATMLAQKTYESQWSHALQAIAKAQDNEGEVIEFLNGVQEVDQCWWHARRMAEEELEILNYERFSLNSLKSEIEKLRAQCS
ncbi:hypothetical protein G9A89_008359 [Geosiphon pyriformis]|nr:hypothetical protein G9A89_008359 [Geosiphon pyriformis]